MGILANPRVEVNNDVVLVVPNSVSYTEGFGEQVTRTLSGGGGNFETVSSEDIESKFSTVKFDVAPTVDAIELAREWKNNGENNLVQISGKTPDGKTLSRTFTKARLSNNYDVALGKDTNISLEFTTKSAI